MEVIPTNEVFEMEIPPRNWAREFRTVEKWQIGINAFLAVVGGIAPFIYHGQLQVMQGQLDQMRGGSAQTEKLINETHGLAEAADMQSQRTETVAEAARAQATAAVEQTQIAMDSLEQARRNAGAAHASGTMRELRMRVSRVNSGA